MSIEIMKTVWDHSEQSGTKRLVLLAIADMSNADGYSWPSIPRIAAMCKCTGRYILKIIPELEESSELYVDHRPGRTRGNVYFVTINIGIDDFAKRLVHYLDYSPTEALAVATEHLRKGEQGSQTVNYSSPLTRPEKVNRGREKVNYSSEKVNRGREKVNYSSPDPSLTIIDPNEPSSSTAHDDEQRRITKTLSNALQQAGIGLNELIFEQYTELVANYGMESVLRGIQAAVENNKQHRFRYVQTCVINTAQGKTPSQPSTNSASKPADITFKDWLLRTYNTSIATGIKPESELRDEYKTWRVAQGLAPGG